MRCRPSPTIALPTDRRQFGSFGAQSQDTLADAVLGGSRHPGWAVAAMPDPEHATVGDFAPQRVRYRLRRSTLRGETVGVECIDQVGDRLLPVLEQVQRQHVTEFDSLEQQLV